MLHEPSTLKVVINGDTIYVVRTVTLAIKGLIIFVEGDTRSVTITIIIHRGNKMFAQNVCMSFRRHLGTKYSNFRHTIIYIYSICRA